MRLIDADTLKRAFEKEFNLDNLFSIGMGYISIMQEINESPTIDAIQVVRCKDCINNILGENYNPLARHKRDCIFKPDNWFCADGERRNDDKEAD